MTRLGGPDIPVSRVRDMVVAEPPVPQGELVRMYTVM
jgi:hypothetical protein